MIDNTLYLALSAGALGATALLTLPGVFAILAQARDRIPPDNFYEDIDGKATPESTAAFSNKKAKFCTLAFAIVGFALSAAVSVISLLHPLGDGLNIENWLGLGLSVGFSGYYYRLKFAFVHTLTILLLSIGWPAASSCSHKRSTLVRNCLRAGRGGLLFLCCRRRGERCSMLSCSWLRIHIQRCRIESEVGQLRRNIAVGRLLHLSPPPPRGVRTRR